MATNGSLNFVLFVLFVSTGFLLVVVFALFFGDTVASEAGWGTLRYLLAIPVRRPRLASKLMVAMFLSAAALLTLVLMSMAVGALFYGWSPVTTPVGFRLAPGEALARIAGITAYLIASMTMVGALAFMLSVRTDAPLAAVGARSSSSCRASWTRSTPSERSATGCRLVTRWPGGTVRTHPTPPT